MVVEGPSFRRASECIRRDPACRDGGDWRRAPVGAYSTILPAYMTATTSAFSGDDTQVVRDQQHGHAGVVLDLAEAGICAWMVTSSAVVGSSAMRMLGLQDKAMAIMTRCRMPPRNLVGVFVEAGFGEEMPT